VIFIKPHAAIIINRKLLQILHPVTSSCSEYHIDIITIQNYYIKIHHGVSETVGGGTALKHLLHEQLYALLTGSESRRPDNSDQHHGTAPQWGN
jgi:hypothetical protein